MVFILIASAMLCIAAACVVVPLWRGRTTGDTPYEMAYRTEHADQLDELARDLADGRLAAEDHDAARRDLDHELEASLRHAGTGSSTKVKAHRILAVATGALLLIGMGVGYWQLGNWRIAVEGVPAATTHEMDMMVAHLSRRLHTRDQNDLQGWVMLGNAYVLMDRYKDAVEALGRARKLSGDSDPGLLASYAEALTLAEPDQFMQKAAPLFEKVLQNDPTNIRALWYGGLAALNRGDKTLAVQRWRFLLAQNLPAQYQAVVKQALEQAGGQPTAAVPSTPAISSIKIHVILDSKLRKLVSPNETVFIYAEPAGSSGGPPLAVRRFQVRDLPLNITLSDKDAMVKGKQISDFSQIVLTARISKTGNPMAQPGDLKGNATWVRVDGDKVVTVDIKS